MVENDWIRLTPDDQHDLMLLSNAEALAVARQLPEVKVLVEACHRAPLATIAHRMDIEGGGGDCVRRILDALAPFKEAPDG